MLARPAAPDESPRLQSRRASDKSYFQTKEQSARSVIEQHRADYRSLLSGWTRAHSEPKARLHEFVDMVERSPDIAQYGSPIGRLNTELGKSRRELQEGARRLFDLFRDWLSDAIRGLGRSEAAEAGQTLHQSSGGGDV